MDQNNLDQMYISIMEPYEKMLREVMSVPETWWYKSTGWVRQDYFVQMIEIIGEDNMKVASGSSRPGPQDPDVRYSRMSFFISPEGANNIRKWSEDNPRV